MSLADDVEVVRAVLRRYSIERVPEAAVTPDMALGAVDRIVVALEVLEEIAESGHIPDEDVPQSFSSMAHRALET